MATTSLQAESALANPAPLSLHSAGQAFDDLSDELSELSALVWLASHADEWLEPSVSKSLRAIMAGLDNLTAKAGVQSAAFFAASRAGKQVGGQNRAPSSIRAQSASAITLESIGFEIDCAAASLRAVCPSITDDDGSTTAALIGVALLLDGIAGKADAAHSASLEANLQGGQTHAVG